MRCYSQAIYAQLSEEFALPLRSCLIAPDKEARQEHVESLTSYIARLAKVNGLSVSELCCRFIWPLTKLTNKPIFIRENDTYSINGAGIRAHEIQRAVEALTPINARECFSSFEFLQPLIGSTHRQVTKKGLAWCPVCLSEQKDSSNDFVFPLYWQSYSSNCCLKHGVKLVTRCRYCGQEPSPLTAGISHGSCSICFKPLWDSGVDLSSATEEDLWMSEAINDLVNLRFSFANSNSLENWRSVVKKVSAHYPSQAIAEHYLGLSKTLLKRWSKRNRPNIHQLVRVCQRLHIKPAEALNAPGSIHIRFPVDEEPLASEISGKVYHSQILCEQVEAFIVQLIEEQKSMSLKLIAREFGVSIGFLEYKFPDLIKEITRFNEANRKKQQSELDEKLYDSAVMLIENQEAMNIKCTTRALRHILKNMHGHKKLSRRWLRNKQSKID